jgi:neutral ceramidase
MGNGTEGRPARGFRHRLYARALLVEDERSERLAFVVADLGEISLILHRKVAAQVAARAKIGPDRLILSATHTHAGPGHFFATIGYDDFGSSMSGFDPSMLDFLVAQISKAVLMAVDSLRPARAIWGIDTIWGATRNRSLPAFRRNKPAWVSPFPPPRGLDEWHRHIDPTFAMLRVDRQDHTGRFRPAGAFSIFAIHATGNTTRNDLFDGDIHALVERRLERHVDSLNGHRGEFVPRALHLFANGAEGDVSPSMPPETRCKPPVLAKGRRLRGPRDPREPDVWVDPKYPQKCNEFARQYVEIVGSKIGARAVEIFDALGRLLEDSARADRAARLTLARTYMMSAIAGTPETPGRCEPRIGTSTPVGAIDGLSRFLGWRLFGVIPLGFDSAGSARPGAHCQSPKRTFLGPLAPHVLGVEPQVAQLTVVRVGGVVIGTTPGEVTTTAGARIRAAMARATLRIGIHRDSVLLLGLANGYISYVTTPEEYQLQRYEGSSTIAGRETATLLTAQMDLLASALPPRANASPLVTVPPIVVHPGKIKRHFPVPVGPEVVSRQILTRWVAPNRDTLIVDWNDVHPSRVIPRQGQILEIERFVDGKWETVSWDDETQMEIRPGPEAGKCGYRWQARWATLYDRDRYRITLLERPPLPKVTVEVGEPGRSCEP